jgi:peroxiredoxin
MATANPQLAQHPAAAAAGGFDRVLQGLIVVLLAGLSWIIYDTFYERIVMVGDRAPDFSISTDKGQTVTRDSFGGKLLVLNFWATWCPPCIEEIPSLSRFAETMKSKGVVVLGISVDKDQRQYAEFLRSRQIAFETARDPAAEINRSYGTVKFPETYVISADGRVLRKLINAQDWMAPSLLSDIESLLPR